ncbi:MAG: uroporphyrinogen-III synthase [Sphingomonas sp.]
MTRRVAVLRPEPGNAVTVAALARIGLEAIALPLFEVTPLPWTAPGPSAHDGLLLTSANAIRHAGAGLAGLNDLPVFAVGAATAQAAERAGLDVVAMGSEGAAAIAAIAVDRGYRRLLHLAGRDHAPTPPGVTAVIAVYDSGELPVAADALRAIEHGVALLHSPRAARRLASVADAIDRRTVRLAALSPTVADAAGSGWAEVAVAETRDDAALVALAARLAD